MQRIRVRAARLALVLVCISANLICLAQMPTTREGILRDVRQRAHDHAESNSPENTGLIVDLYGNNTVGLTKQDLLNAYDTEYTKDRAEHDKHDWIPKAGWGVAALLFLSLIFLDKVKAALTKGLDFVGEKVFTFFAGIPWFYRLALNRYYKSIYERHSKLRITFRPERPLDLGAVFVPLKVTDEPESTNTFDAYSFMTNSAKLVVTGSPGSGKSILMRHIALSNAIRRRPAKTPGAVPILVELNRLNDPAVTLRTELARELSTKGFPKPDYFLARGLKQGTLLLLLDGLDEIGASQRPSVLKQIRDLAEEFPAVPFIVSCRIQVYNGELNDVVDKTLEIQNFTDQQIRRFLRTWAPDMQAHGKSVEQLMRALTERPTIMALARNPLMLTIIAWLYTDTVVILPHSRSEFYREATELLLFNWKRETNKYPLVPKQLVLRDLALHFQDTADKQQKDRRSMDVQTVLQRIGAILPSLNIDPKDANPLLDEIVQRSGLLLAIDGGERYQFAHLTLQEYFAAVALRSKPKGLLDRFRTDPDAWREPVKLWCGLDEDATDFIDAVYQIDPVTGFECLADTQKISSKISNHIIDEMKQRLLANESDTAVIKAFGSVASSLSDRGRAVFNWLRTQTVPQALEALSYTNMPQAAEVLAQLYPAVPTARPLLTRLQELAVPHLQALAREGYPSAVHDLLAIGTPGAAEALVPLLWQKVTNSWASQDLNQHAAFALASLLQSPEVFNTLRDLEINHPSEHGWIWQPFSADEKTAIPIIAGRIGHLLEDAHAIPNLPEVRLDARIMLPLCARSSDKMTAPTSINYASTITLEDIHKTVIPRAEVKAIDSETTPIIADKQEVPNKLEVMALDLFERLSPNERFRFCFSRLRPVVQIEFIRGIFSSRLPNQEDWVNIFNPIYRGVRGGWHLWIPAILTQLIALFCIARLIFYTRPITVHPVVLSIILAAGVVVVIALFREEKYEDYCTFMLIMSSGPALIMMNEFKWKTFFSGAKDLSTPGKLGDFALNITLLFIVVTWSPAWIIATYLVTRHWLGVVPTLIILAVFIAAMIALWLRARHLYRLSNNPLSGLRRLLQIEPDEAEPTRGSRFAMGHATQRT